MIKALNEAEPAVFALMDYWTFDGWFALKRRLGEPNAPKLEKTVFPGIELRLMSPMKGRLNAHVVFSDKIDNQTLNDFRSALIVELVNRPLSDTALRSLARTVTAEKLKAHGFSKPDVDLADAIALKAGSTIAEINCDSYKEAIAAVPDGMAIGFMPYDTHDGLAEVDWVEHYAFFIGLAKNSPIFESRNLTMRDALVGVRTSENERFIDSIQRSLKDVPRLVVAGSDAHRLVGTPGDQDKRGYGDFPSGKITWIKADPTFLGLQQAIREPAKRSFIGTKPPKAIEVERNKTFFIDKVEVSKVVGASASGDWLAETALPLNPDLVAIIGNKGSGKSALADIIALLGNSKQKAHFSFLKKDRFRGKSGDPAKHFDGRLTWVSGASESRNLNDDPPESKVELVRYIPQGHFEELCNAHVSGKSDSFENELRAVIFSHANESTRLGALDFNQLIEQQEGEYRDRLGDYRNDLRKLNEEIASIEDQLRPEAKKEVTELLIQKSKEIEEHEKLKPEVLPVPDAQLTPEQNDASQELDLVVVGLKEKEEAIERIVSEGVILASKVKAAQNVRGRMLLLDKNYKQFITDSQSDFESLGVDHTDLMRIEFNFNKLSEIIASSPGKQLELSQRATNVEAEKQKIQARQSELEAKLAEPQLLYQQSLQALQQWNEKFDELIGTPIKPESRTGLQARLTQIEMLPQRLNECKAQRNELAERIYEVLDSQRKAREALFAPVQELIINNSLIREEYKLQFQATLGASADSIAASLFNLIKQNAGEFRGEDESFNVVRRLAEQFDLNEKSQALDFVRELNSKIEAASNSKSLGASSMLRKEIVANQVYDFLFGLGFLEPKYSLLFQDAQIEQLSPGQRGALLLIFYLLVDKGRTPIILDQPEENLDNETVVSLLVPVLTEAKKKRQIIMVTHNPNLAVVCDAEQVIWSVFERKNKSKITYQAGSIENPLINQQVVNVLEGTMPAFSNRRIKYH
ncbi:ABC transporter [Pseudomonas aeruginosa]|nr:ABC transporter [Pseudomonas aeruginosa]MCD2830658.1 ABC transporter [Pseudomonas aeruginosa]RUI01391.1 ABC transporter [Pseudomonas aeruginosa]HCF4146254.1 ABC transporter [Pseudomonas aeruginosa]HCK3347105.1 ABC transporter [Pseudomonas aeruginosa]